MLHSGHKTAGGNGGSELTPGKSRVRRQQNEGCRGPARRRTVDVTRRCCCCCNCAIPAGFPALLLLGLVQRPPLGQSLQSSTWQTYFSTVFKTELTVAAKVGEADGDHRCSYLVLSSQSSCPARLANDGLPAIGPRCLLGLWGQRWGAGATGGETESSRDGGAAGKRAMGAV